MSGSRLTPRQASVLRRLARRGPCPASDAAGCEMTASQAAGCLKRLLKRGLVDREGSGHVCVWTEKWFVSDKGWRELRELPSENR